MWGEINSPWVLMPVSSSVWAYDRTFKEWGGEVLPRHTTETTESVAALQCLSQPNTGKAELELWNKSVLPFKLCYCFFPLLLEST